ncbi:hypothetical protein ASD44_09570 [Mesorhizobium sp. Root554]|uniref:hypothetical protein n=1 Tax=unclassified Mesorhizobium TaxID=325217 RepID=UPI0006F956CE|nr:MULTISPECIES: hypothetical protein [unclassified Mesorhizobium]KQZ14291.1 hypothetical protein ASD27_09580 [Mesorhizobium sp. Root1471]KQZ36802.1 hypothetical protein ASD44_09570 [Mesorhizobium sp. Root554]
MEDKSGKRWSWGVFGFVLTALYLLVLGISGLLHGPASLIHWEDPMSPNEAGDFLAGIFAPLAFLWLFVATMVQSQELALQRQELELTRQELKATREVAAEQAAEARSQAKFIGEQTAMMQAQEVDKEIQTRLRWLFDFSDNKLKGPMTFGDDQGNVMQIRAPFDDMRGMRTLRAIVEVFNRRRRQAESALESYPNRVASYANADDFIELRHMVLRIQAIKELASSSTRAELQQGHFLSLAADVEFFFDLLRHGETLTSDDD